MKLSRLIPAFEWLSSYRTTDFRYDLLASLTVTIVLVPQAMAYALLAGLPPIYGLYASIVPLVLYALFGSSRQLSVGPVALVSLLVLAGLSEMAEPGTERYIGLAISVALLTGAIQIVLGLLKLGFLNRFLSHPVIAGFTSAAAFIICFSQLKHILGIEIARSSQIQQIVTSLVQNVDQSHGLSMMLGIGTIVFMLIMKKVKKSFPSALVVVVAGTLLVWGFQWHEQGVAIVGKVPKGLPAFIIPNINMQDMGMLLPLALTICLISFIESLAIAKTLEGRHNTYQVSANQELIALGITKVAGSFFQSYPTTGSFTRSAINDEAGARSGMSSILSALLVALVLLFLTPLFEFLPQAVLGGIIISAVIGLIDWNKAAKLWNLDRRDFISMIVTFIITLMVGVQEGVLTGIILSLSLILYRNSKPHIAILGQLPGSTYYRNVERFPDAVQNSEVLIMRFDAQLYFGNSDYFKQRIQQLVQQKGNALKLLVLDAASIHDIDSSGISTLKEVVKYVDSKGIDFYISGAIGPVRDLLFKSGIMDMMGSKTQFMYVHNALQYYHQSIEQNNKGWTPDALQTNVPDEEKL